MKGLAAGRNVHYVEQNGTHSPAIIEYVWNEQGTVNLFIMRNDGVLRDHRSQTSVMYSEEPDPGTWHWIEKA